VASLCSIDRQIEIIRQMEIMCVCLCVFTTEGVTTTSAESSDEDGKYLGRCVS